MVLRHQALQQHQHLLYLQRLRVIQEDQPILRLMRQVLQEYLVLLDLLGLLDLLAVLFLPR